MRNCIVLGCGRSGTSMVAGALHGAGFFAGEDLMPPTPGNPKGYFESFAIEAINETLLFGVCPPRRKGILGPFTRHRMGRAQRWLARVPLDAPLPCPAELTERIRRQVAHTPFAFKDPRFCYTLPAWRPHLPETVFICVFRDPRRTVQSILTECREEAYLKDLPMDEPRAYEVWMLMHRHILDRHSRQGHWLFLHYDQILEGGGLDRLDAFVEARVDRSFVEPALRRSAAKGRMPESAARLYATLCERAGWTPADG